jgi:hypothetical protein
MPTYTSTTVIAGAPLTTTTAFPAAAATANTAGFQLSLATVSRAIRAVAAQVSWPALATHTDPAKIITLTLQDGTDNSNWTNVNPLIQVQLPGVATNGAAADQFRMPLPSHIQAYARIRIDVPSGGPSVTNKDVTTSLVTV